MSLVVQDDTGTVVGANGYLSAAAFAAYHLDRGTDTTDFDSPDIDAAIVKGTDYVDTRFRYIGEPLSYRQPTEWPRRNAYNRYREYINGVPEEVKEACAEYALRDLQGDLNPDPTLDASGRIVQSKAEAVGPISEEVRFVDGDSFRLPRYPTADNKLTKPGLTLGGGDVRRA